MTCLLLVLLACLCGVTLGYQVKNLAEGLELTRGVYADQDKIATSTFPNLNRTVFVTAGNMGYLPLLHNFYCHALRLRLKVLMVSMDDDVHRAVANWTNIYSYRWPRDSVSTGQTTFRSPEFVKMSNIKIISVRANRELA